MESTEDKVAEPQVLQLRDQLAHLRGVLAEEHRRVLELQRQRDSLEAQLALRQQRVDDLLVEVAILRQHQIGGQVVLVHGDPVPRSGVTNPVESVDNSPVTRELQEATERAEKVEREKLKALREALKRNMPVSCQVYTYGCARHVKDPAQWCGFCLGQRALASEAAPAGSPIPRDALYAEYVHDPVGLAAAALRGANANASAWLDAQGALDRLEGEWDALTGAVSDLLWDEQVCALTQGNATVAMLAGRVDQAMRASTPAPEAAGTGEAKP